MCRGVHMIFGNLMEWVDDDENAMLKGAWSKPTLPCE